MEPLALIAAIARSGAIGRDGDLPWRLPDDLKHFKRTTLGHHLILGRKTWEALPGALPGRTSVVITRRPGYAAEGALVVGSLDAAIDLAREQGDDEPVVAGGAEIYALALPRATRLWITRIHADIDGDVYFPQWSEEGWWRASAIEHAADARHAHAFTIEQWRRLR